MLSGRTHEACGRQISLCSRKYQDGGDKNTVGYIVNSLDYYSYRLIGKLTAFLQLQECSLRNLPVEDSFTFGARRSLRSLGAKSAAP